MSFGILRLLLTTHFQTSLPRTTQSKNLLQSEQGASQTINTRAGGRGGAAAAAASQKQRSHSEQQVPEVTGGQTTHPLPPLLMHYITYRGHCE